MERHRNPRPESCLVSAAGHFSKSSPFSLLPRPPGTVPTPGQGSPGAKPHPPAPAVLFSTPLNLTAHGPEPSMLLSTT